MSELAKLDLYLDRAERLETELMWERIGWFAGSLAVVAGQEMMRRDRFAAGVVLTAAGMFVANKLHGYVAEVRASIAANDGWIDCMRANPAAVPWQTDFPTGDPE